MLTHSLEIKGGRKILKEELRVKCCKLELAQKCPFQRSLNPKCKCRFINMIEAFDIKEIYIN